MKTYRIYFFLLVMLLVMPMTVSAKFYPSPQPNKNYIDSLTKMVEQGNLEAQIKLVLKYRYSWPSHVLYPSLIYIDSLRKVAEQGDVKAQRELWCTVDNKNEAAKWYLKLVEKEDPETLNDLGDEFCWVKMYAEAIKWYRKAAEQGDVDAQTRLGDLYFYGKSVKQDYAEALKWYRKAAEQGDGHTQELLGDLYFNGEGVKQDYVEAAKWYRKAAEQGLGPAHELGELYAEGKGVKQDYDEALKWYRKAAEHGYDCYEKLGDLYAVTHNYTEAAKWYQKATDKNDDEARLKLGLCYATGKGVKQSFSKAAKLIKNELIVSISDVIAYEIGAVMLIMFILLLYVYSKKKQFGLFRSIILAFSFSALFFLAMGMILIILSMFMAGNLLPLIASDVLLFYGFVILSLFSIFLIGLAIFGISRTINDTNSISAESKNETSEDSLMNGKKGHKVKFDRDSFFIGFAKIAFLFLIGFAYYWFTTKALGHEPLSPFALDLEDKDPAFIIDWLIFFVAFILGFIVTPLLPRLVLGWRNTHINWKSLSVYCSKPLKKSRYIKGVVTPFFILGILPLLVSPFVNNFGMCLFGIIFACVTADYLMWVWKLRKEPRDCMIQDIKGEYACFVLDEDQPVNNE